MVIEKRRFVSVSRQKGVFLGVGVLLVGLDSTPGVVRGRIDGRQLQRAIAIVENVVPGAAGHKDSVTNMQRARAVQMAFVGAHLDNSFAGLHSDALVRIGMHLKADVIADRDAHQGHLKMMTGPECSSVVFVCTCGTGNVGCIRVGAVVSLVAVAETGIVVHGIFLHFVM